MNETILELHDIVKTFGGVTALNGVQFSLKRGEVHALMGENGAGKSTVIKIMTGALQPDSGTILLEQKPVLFRSTNDSQKAGIAAVYQHSTAFSHLSVTENIFMGDEIYTKLHTYNWKAMKKKARSILQMLHADISENRRMSTLSVAQQQLAEIAKALSRNARIIIMDEPTSALTSNECENLYRIVEQLKRDGISVIFITHKFEDMYRVAERITVFRDSGYIGTWGIDEISNDKLIEAMVGRKLEALYPEKTAHIGETVLEVQGLCSTGYFKDISFAVRRGEILALTGLVGAGRSEVVQAIFGTLPLDAGEILIEGKPVRIKRSSDALKAGIGLLPEDRQVQGLLAELPLYQNVTAANLDKFIRRFSIDQEKEKRVASALCARIQLKARDILDFPTALSGGNQQKVVFAKLLNCELKVLILDEPTKGIDVGAKQSIYAIMNELACQGYAIVMISSEMPEVLGMADRVVVMSRGRCTAKFSREEATQEKILAASVLQGASEQAS